MESFVRIISSKIHSNSLVRIRRLLELIFHDQIFERLGEFCLRRNPMSYITRSVHAEISVYYPRMLRRGFDCIQVRVHEMEKDR